MSRRIAVFLRGLNVGGHRVKMARLRELLAAGGFAGVETLLASGNVVIDSGGEAPSGVETRIESLLEEGLGYAVPSFVRSLEEVEAAVAGPFTPADEDGPDHARYVLFLRRSVDDSVRGIFAAMESDRDSFGFADREVHWLSRGRISESPLFGGRFDRETRGLAHTMRNVNTLRRLVDKYGVR
ncbi:MAG: DUF1697 domain-containing protein [Gemmatimonadetes bacterium]|nr:DUF1697 domain-containing protein [Gemmatimonadota bacterium]